MTLPQKLDPKLTSQEEVGPCPSTRTHEHDWGKWSAVQSVAPAIISGAYMQIRQCEKCGIAQKRFV